MGLKLGFLATLLSWLLLVVYLLLQGERPDTRQASAGILVLPMFSALYIFLFKHIRPTITGVIGHILAIASTGYLATCIYLHHTKPKTFDVTESPYLLLLCASILGYGVSIGMIAHATGFFSKGKTKKEI